MTNTGIAKSLGFNGQLKNRKKQAAWNGPFLGNSNQGRAALNEFNLAYKVPAYSNRHNTRSKITTNKASCEVVKAF